MSSLEREVKDMNGLNAINGDEPLAIIGLDCCFPGKAQSADAFWQLLNDGEHAVSKVPGSRWDADDIFSPDSSEPGKCNSVYGCFLTRDIAAFDAKFFGISPSEASLMDPQQRLLLEVTWTALERSGINPKSLKSSLTGVYIGSCLNDYQSLLYQHLNLSDITAHMGTGNSASVLAGRLAYFLGLKGAAICCDTACSSSLTAVHLASQALRSGEVNMAIAGGVNLIMSPQNSVIFSKSNMLSADGKCRTFDKRANGYVRGEGCGIVIIKRLNDALSANDNILAVIRGSAVNQDGDSSGLTVPNLTSQVNVIKSALVHAHLTVDDIDVIEAHGTGTQLGDPIEVEAIKKVFKGKKAPLTIGSVKTNIGHLEGAAGIAGLLKMVLALSKQQIPKHLHFNQLNPMIDISNIDIDIPTDNKPWPIAQKHVRRAGISSFGFSGTNAHLIIEEPPACTTSDIQKDSQPLFLFLFSAKSETSLDNYLTKFQKFLQESEAGIADISYSLNISRAPLNHRRVVIAASTDELIGKIEKREFFKPNPVNKNTSLRYPDLEEKSLSIWQERLEHIASHLLTENFIDLAPLERRHETYRKKVPLPSYAFDYKSYWFKKTPDNKSNSSHHIYQYQREAITLNNGDNANDDIVCYVSDNPLPHFESMDKLIKVDKNSLDDNLTDKRLSGVLYYGSDANTLLTLIQNIKNRPLPLGLMVVIKKDEQLSSSPCLGLVQALQWEAPHLNAKSVVVDNVKEINSKNIISLMRANERELYITSDVIEKHTICEKVVRHCSMTSEDFSGVHWVVGGTGGIGRWLIKWLLDNGANKIIISGRRGFKESDKAFLNELDAYSHLIDIRTLDICHQHAVVTHTDELVDTYGELKGIYHLAGIESQVGIDNLSNEEFNRVLSPKVEGAWNLHQASLILKPRYFVLFSSIASFLGSKQQLPYVCANRYLDELSLYRKREGLPVTAINWGPINQGMTLKKGIDADTEGLLSKVDLLNSLENAMAGKLSNILVVDDKYLPFMCSFMPDKYLNSLGDIGLKCQSSDKQQLSSYAKELLLLTSEERLAQLKNIIEQQIKDILHHDDTIDHTEGFQHLGLNSLDAIDIGRQLKTLLGVSLKPTAGFDYPSIEKLSYHLDELLTETKGDISPRDNARFSPMAIIGMSCQFPGGANDIMTFWQKLIKGYDAISEFPSERTTSAINNENINHKKRYGGFIDNIKEFDADFFKISPREATCLDPQQRMLLENTWHALEMAGINPLSLRGKKVGVFIGISQSEYASGIVSKQTNSSAYYATGNALNVAAGRIAYFLGTTGPAKAIDTACSSSLVAINDAAISLIMGECELAIVGGVNAILDEKIFDSLADAEMLAHDGHCKVFDSRADGYVRAEGCGVIILKPQRKLAFEDNVLAIIKSTNINQDGDSSGLTVPNGVSQKALIQQAISRASLEASDIDYVEMHGTGTQLGDPIEYGALVEVFKHRSKPLVVGTVKANIGHLESAAGIAGVIKTVLSLKHQYIPPHINCFDINPHINLAALPAELPIKGRKWQVKAGKKRRAGVSSFGFSGTNAHIILEEFNYTAPQKKGTSQSAQLFFFSAKTKRSLDAYLDSFVVWLESNDGSDLEAISYTLNLGRAHFKHRLAVIADSESTLIEKINRREVINEENNDNSSCKLYQLAHRYIAGEDINGSFLYDEPCKLAILPGYQFDKKTYWLTTPSKNSQIDNDKHPLLQAHAYSHRHQEELFTTTINAEQISFIDDHKIYHVPVIAGASYLSMLVSIASQDKKQQQSLFSQIEFIQPLIIKEDESKQLQLSISKAKQIEVNSYIEGETAYTCHMRAVIDERKDSFHTAFDLETIKANCQATYTAKEHLINTQRLNLQLGQQFHWIDKVYYSDDALLATFRQPMAEERRGYILHPGFIDSSFQSMMAWLGGDIDTKTLHIPTAIASFKCRGLNAYPAYVYIRKDDKSETADLFYLDEFGTPLIEIIGFKAAKITSTTFSKLIEGQSSDNDYLYHTDWQVQALDDIDYDNLPSLAVDVFSPHKKQGARFINALSPWRVHLSYGELTSSDIKHLIYVYPSSKKADSNALITCHQTLLPVMSQQGLQSLCIVFEDNLSASLIQGYIKTLRLEKPNIKVFSICVDSFKNSKAIAGLVKRMGYNLFGEYDAKWSNNRCYVPRLLNHDLWHKRHPIVDYPDNYATLKSDNGLVESLEWHTASKPSLGAHDIRVDIRYTSLNFRDVLKVIGTYPGKAEWHIFEHAGVVTEIGPAVSSVSVGDNVITLKERHFTTYIQTNEHSVYRVPKHLDLQHACSIPGVYLTAFNCLYQLAKITSKTKLLIHAASGGVGLAAIQLAKARNAEIFVTTSESKVTYLRSMGIKHIYNSRALGFAKKLLKVTGGQGVDVVLNSLTGEGFIDESLLCLKRLGTFIELSKINIYSKETMRSLRSDIDYHIFALDELMAKQPERIREQMNDIIKLHQAGVCQQLPTTCFDIRESIEAFRYLQKALHIGKVIIEHGKPFYYKENAQYLITGGMGGLATLLIQHLIAKGVKHITAVGRKPIGEISEIFNELKSGDIDLQYHAMDISDKTKLRALFKKINQSKYPLAGIFHLAGAILDKPIEQLSADDFEEVYRAKVHGSMNLHTLSKQLPLDCFVMFSSVSSVFGSPGQANYASANGFLDALAEHRRAQHQPALSINWGPFAERGMARQHIQKFKVNGLYPIEQNKAFRLMDKLIYDRATSTTIADINWQKNAFTRFYTKYLSLIHTKKQTSQVDFVEKLSAASEDKREAILINELQTIVATTLYIDDIDDVDIEMGFFDMGFDSLMSVDMWNRLQILVGSRLVLSKTLFFEYDNIYKLAQYLKREVFADLFQLHEKENVSTPSSTIDHHQPTLVTQKYHQKKIMRSIDSIDHLFITGGTGVLGSYLIKTLLENTNYQLHCLIRAHSIDEATIRLEKALSSYGMSNNTFTEYKKRLFLYTGDISLPNLGISDAEYNTLAGKVDRVIHTAANLALNESYESLYDTNVKGTKHVIDFCKRTDNKHLMYVSSYSVMASLLLTKTTPLVETQLDLSQDFTDMGYSKTKFESEKLIHKAMNDGLQAQIVRAGDIFGDSETGIFPIATANSLFYDLLKTVIETGVAPITPLYFDITPVDFIARAMTHLIQKSAAFNKTYYLTNPNPQAFPEVIKVIRQCGYAIELISSADYIERIYAGRLQFKGARYQSQTIEMIQYKSSRFIPEFSTPIDATWTTEVLDKAHIHCPKADKTLLTTLLSYCVDEGYIPSVDAMQSLMASDVEMV